MSLNQDTKRLFRAEATSRSDRVFTGTVLLTQPRRFTVATYMLITLFVVATLLILQFKYSGLSWIGGRVKLSREPIPLRANSDARITRILVRDDQDVKSQEALFELSTIRSTASNTSSKDIATEIQERLRLQNDERSAADTRYQNAIAGLNGQLRALDSRKKLNDQEVASQRQRIQIRSDSLDTYLSLRGFFSEAQINQQRDLLLEQQQKLQQLDRSNLELQDDRLRLFRLRQEATDRFSQEQRTAELATSQTKQLLTEFLATQNVIITAPVAGKIALLTTDSLQDVKKDQILGLLIPEGAEPEIILYGQGEGIALMRPGDEISIRYDAFPYVRFGEYRAKTISISPVSSYAANSPDAADRGFQVRARPQLEFVRGQDEKFPLKAGMTLQAAVSLERRSVWDWLVDSRARLSGR